MEPTEDILASLAPLRTDGQTIVAFAAENGNDVERAREKLVRKNADLMVANDITQTDAGFRAATNRVTLLRRAGDEAAPPAPEALPLMDKRHVAERIAAEVAALLGG